MLLPYLNPAGDPALVQRYVQEHAITTPAMVADASEVTFAKVRLAVGDCLVDLISLILALSHDYTVVVERATECRRTQLQEAKNEGNCLIGEPDIISLYRRVLKPVL